MGYMRVDPADGSVYIGTTAPGSTRPPLVDRQKTHYFVIRSTDGGATWEPAVPGLDHRGRRALRRRTRPSSAATTTASTSTRGWPGRCGSTAAGHRTAGEEEIVIRKLCSEPSHWSERAPTFTTPAVTVRPAAPRMTVSWDAPDLYWGDGGENPAARKYQLWVDGALVQDNSRGPPPRPPTPPATRPATTTWCARSTSAAWPRTTWPRPTAPASSSTTSRAAPPTPGRTCCRSDSHQPSHQPQGHGTPCPCGVSEAGERGRPAHVEAVAAGPLARRRPRLPVGAQHVAPARPRGDRASRATSVAAVAYWLHGSLETT